MLGVATKTRLESSTNKWLDGVSGLVNYRATEVPTCARFLTILALYYSYTHDTALLLKHFAKARALATWLLHRRKASLSYPVDDPRYGIPLGDDEADTYVYGPCGRHLRVRAPWRGIVCCTYRSHFCNYGVVSRPRCVLHTNTVAYFEWRRN